MVPYSRHSSVKTSQKYTQMNVIIIAVHIFRIGLYVHTSFWQMLHGYMHMALVGVRDGFISTQVSESRNEC